VQLVKIFLAGCMPRALTLLTSGLQKISPSRTVLVLKRTNYKDKVRKNKK